MYHTQSAYLCIIEYRKMIIGSHENSGSYHTVYAIECRQNIKQHDYTYSIDVKTY